MNHEEFEKRAELKHGRRDKKKKQTMRVSGSSVKKIQKIIAAKPKGARSTD